MSRELLLEWTDAISEQAADDLAKNEQFACELKQLFRAVIDAELTPKEAGAKARAALRD